MASSSSNSNGICHVRSVSLPSRSHPTTCSIEDVLHMLKHFDTKNTSSFKSATFGLSKLEDLYRCMTNLLDMASTQQILRRQVGCSNALLDSSLHLLDVCSVARDLVLQVKEYVQLFESILRRRKEDLGMTRILSDYINFRNKARKNAKRLNLAMKQNKNRVDVVSQIDEDLESSVVTRALMEVDELSAVIFQSILCPFLNPVLGTKSRWSSISRLMPKGTVACEENPVNLDELKYIDAAIHALTRGNLEGGETDKIRLQDAESNINSLELALESLFRQLVRARASLLNIISQ